MNAVLTNGNGQYFVRGTKVAIFDLPETKTESDIEIEVDTSDAERTLKRGAVRADGTEEIDPGDILAEFPVDPEEPFELRVPPALLARAAQLTSALPRERRLAQLAQVAQPANDVEPDRARALRRGGWILATVLGTCIGIVLAAGLASYENAPIASVPAPQLKAARAAAKVLERHNAVASTFVPTVSFDSLPRARR